MCYYTKHRFVAAIVCLKRAIYLDPFAWIVSYNLGLCYLQTGQHASAFRYLKATIQLNDKIASAFAHLGVALGRLGEFENGYDVVFSLVHSRNTHTHTQTPGAERSNVRFN